MSSRSLVALLLAGGLITLGASPPSSQPPPQDPQRPPIFRTETNFVRVDVYASLKGAPVKDLAMADFEVLEEGVPQKLSTFEYVQVNTGMPQELRNEPNTIQQSRDALRNPRARVFVLFLDLPHVTIDGTWNAREALVRMVDRLMGPEDLIGIMTPLMSPTDVVFARKTNVIAGGLMDAWPWGDRHTMFEEKQDQLYKDCYPWPTDDMQSAVREMIARRKERATLDAMRDLVRWLRDQREERKAVITVSEGWLLYRPNSDLTRLRIIDAEGTREAPPGPDPMGVGIGGKITLGTMQMDKDGMTGGRKSECDRERQHLSTIDDSQFFRDIMELANTANASFYTIDPRGLAVFDYPLGPAPPPGLVVDAAHLRNRAEALRTLADNTDGLTVIGNNNLEPGLKRISDDLTSYYLLGYYSSNAKLDGRFRRLSVKVKRPGVDVRARRGYRAATKEEISAARSAAAAVVPESVTAANAALGALARLRPEAKLHTQAIAVQGTGVTVWFAGELARPVAAATTATVTVGRAPGSVTIELPLAAGQRAFMGSAALDSPPAGPIEVRVRVAPAGDIPFTDTIRVEPGDGLTAPLMFRRGPATGNRYEPAGQPQFSRSERVRFDVPRSAGALTRARVLDRNGNPIELTIARSEREGWFSAEITLAAFGPGDYLLELVRPEASGGERKVLVPFRVAR